MRSTKGELFDIFSIDPESIERRHTAGGMLFVANAMSSGGKKRRLRILLGGFEVGQIVKAAAEHATLGVKDALRHREMLANDFNTRIKNEV